MPLWIVPFDVQDRDVAPANVLSGRFLAVGFVRRRHERAQHTGQAGSLGT